MNKKEAETLLKYGAYDFFKEEREGRTEELSNAFCEADIDQILEKKTLQQKWISMIPTSGPK